MVIDIDKFQSLIPRRPDGRADEVYLLFSNKSQQEIESMSGKMRRNKQAKKFSEWKIDCESVKRFFPWFSSLEEIIKFPALLSALFIAHRMKRERERFSTSSGFSSPLDMCLVSWFRSLRHTHCPVSRISKFMRVTVLLSHNISPAFLNFLISCFHTQWNETTRPSTRHKILKPFFTADEKHLKTAKSCLTVNSSRRRKSFRGLFFYKLLNCKKAGRQREPNE